MIQTQAVYQLRVSLYIII